LRCLKCGADLTDPDVLAMAAAEPVPMPASGLGDLGQLSSDKFLGVSRETLLEGGALRIVSLVGGIALILAFLIPIPKDPYQSKWWMAWSVGKPFAKWAFWFPLLFGAAGVALAFLPKPDRWIRAIILAAMSLFGILFLMPRLAAAGGGYRQMMPLFALGLVAAACAMTLRVYFPLERPPRIAIIVATAVTIVGLALPMAKAGEVMPFEFSVFHGGALKDASLLGLASDSFDEDMMVRLIGLYTMLVMVLFAGASAAAWPVPGGVWDKTSFVVRPVTWAVVLYWPMQKAVLVFNITGWTAPKGSGFRAAKQVSNFSNAIMITRTRMVLVTAVFVLWAVFSAVVIYKHFRPGAGASVKTTEVG